MDYEKFWREVAELAEEYRVNYIQAHERTFDALKLEWGLTEGETKRVIDRLLSDGLLGERKAKTKNGKIATVYFPINHLPEQKPK